MEKGKLKIFFGYSAGVGKTYSMLSEAQKLRLSGVDIVIGYVEPHAREETMALCEGLERIPLKSVMYHGITISEFDVDSALARRPEIILVDELAHTNIENSKHKKRYQDILELLNNGISVFTTVNVQHLEGLNDVIDSALAVKVGETVPDEIFDRADDVELIDIEPNELLERLKNGKVYKGEKIVSALENFFTEEHLNSLREVSMRRSADRIVKINTVSEISPKILVLISPSPSSGKNIRIAAQMASNYHSKFSAMYVERSGELDDDSAKTLKAHIKLVADLGGEIVIKYADSVVETIETYVKINGVTNIIIGKTWQSIGKKVGLEEQIISVLPDVEVLIVPDKQSSGTHNRKRASKIYGKEKILIAIFSVITLGAISLFFVNSLVSMIVLCVVATLSFGLYTYENHTKLSLNSRFRQSNRALDCINLLSIKLSSMEQMLSKIALVLAETFERSALISLGERVVIRKYDGEDISFFSSSQEKAILNWCKTNSKPAGLGSDTLRASQAIYFPVEVSLPTKSPLATIESGSTQAYISSETEPNNLPISAETEPNNLPISAENTSNKMTAVIGISCIKTKMTVTDKMLFSQIKNTLSLLLSD